MATDRPTAARPTPLLDVLRGLTAAGVITSAVVHLDLYGAGFSTISVIGPLFLLNAVAGLILGLAVLVWRHWLPALVSAGFAAVTVLAYWWSVLFGLFGIREVTGGWSVILAEIAEYLAVLCGLAVTVMLLSGRRVRRGSADRPHRAPETVGVQ